MILLLRKKHFQIWLVLSILIPVGIISAYKVIPETTFDNNTFSNHVEQFPIVVASVDSPEYLINIRKSSTDSVQWQLEWINKVPLIVPSAWIYIGLENSKSIDDCIAVGCINNKTVYRFHIPDLTDSRTRWILYDALHKKIIYNQIIDL